MTRAELEQAVLDDMEEDEDEQVEMTKEEIENDPFVLEMKAHILSLQEARWESMRTHWDKHKSNRMA